MESFYIYELLEFGDVKLVSVYQFYGKCKSLFILFVHPLRSLK